MAHRLGIDIGGTFTDATLINDATGTIRTSKVSSTPQDPAQGFMEATARILQRARVVPDEVSFIVHGTTVATNSIIEGKTATTGFITTEGFRDLLEIARQIRPTLYDLQFEKPPPLVPRSLAYGVPERLDARGQVLVPLDEQAVNDIIGQLRHEGVQSIAVCLLHAYANPEHEQRIAQIIRREFPEAVVSLSSEVAPEFREYYRASTTVINACIRPIVARYLQSIEQRLHKEGVRAELLVMQSSGGVYTFAVAAEKPVYMVESGPAAGVISASYLGAALGFGDVISFDMGGTTAKAGLVQNGTPRISKDYEVGAVAQSGAGMGRGAGYPIRTPVIDLVEIGAGGGSIAWVDPGGILRVGPHSAGADPGPACYGLGGTEPTITDANLLLGRLNPDYFLGGEIELDVDAARSAIEIQCARPLGMEVIEAAHGIVEIANAAMVNALHLVSVQRGYDPRDFVLVAFGGAGPVHANRLAAEAEIPTIVIPMSPGTTSAMGLLVSDLKHDYSTTRIERFDPSLADQLEAAFRELEGDGRCTLEREGMSANDMEFRRQVEIRYLGQSHELTLPLSAERMDRAGLDRLLTEFHCEHERIYGFSAPDEPVELVNLVLTAVGRIVKPQLARLEPTRSEIGAAQKATRQVYFAEAGGFVDCPIYDRYALGAGRILLGPAIVEEVDSTTVIHPGFEVRVDDFGNLLVSFDSSE